jgi:hypothetical protein
LGCPAYENVEEVKSVLAQGAAQKDSVVVTSKKEIAVQPLTVIDLETCKELVLNVTIHNATKSTAKLTRNRPTAYILEASETDLVEKLKVLGLKVEQLTLDKEIQVETFTIIDYSRELEKYEGMNLQTVKTITKQENLKVLAGAYIIYLNQDNSNLAVEVLEPEAPNSFISFGVLETTLNAVLPIYRYLKTEKL